MVELGELERRHQDFDQRNVTVFVVSNDSADDARLNQVDFPHLKVVSDQSQDLAKAAGMIHPGANRGEDTNAPTTLLVDGSGTVRWLMRRSNSFDRIPPDELLAAIDEHLASASVTMP